MKLLDTIKSKLAIIKQYIVLAWTYVRNHVIAIYTKLFVKKPAPQTEVMDTLFHVKKGSIFGTIAGAAGSFFDTAKIWIFSIMAILIVLLSGGLYFYYNYSQSELSAATSAAAQAIASFNQEKTAFQQMQMQNQDLLNKLGDYQKKQEVIQLQNDALKKTIQSYDSAPAKTNPSKAQKDANSLYNQVLKKLESDTNLTTSVKKGK